MQLTLSATKAYVEHIRYWLYTLQ